MFYTINYKDFIKDLTENKPIKAGKIYITNETNKPTLSKVSALANFEKNRIIAVSLVPKPDTVIGIILINITKGMNIRIDLKVTVTFSDEKRI